MTPVAITDRLPLAGQPLRPPVAARPLPVEPPRRLTHSILTNEQQASDVALVLAACDVWLQQGWIMRRTGLGVARILRAIINAGSRLERQTKTRDGDENHLVYQYRRRR